MALTWSERIEAKGFEIGLKKGIQQRKREEREALRVLKKVLLRLLEYRFGPLPEETRGKVEAISSLARLCRLCERVLPARSLASLRL